MDKLGYYERHENRNRVEYALLGHDHATLTPDFKIMSNLGEGKVR